MLSSCMLFALLFDRSVNTEQDFVLVVKRKNNFSIWFFITQASPLIDNMCHNCDILKGSLLLIKKKSNSSNIFAK